jgi:hypothetical protein
VRTYEEEDLLHMQGPLGPRKIHYIEVAIDTVDSEEEKDSGSTSSEEEPSQA